MAEAPATQPSLLIRLGDKQDTVAWAQFVEVYAPLVYGFARKHGMQDADAADLTQEVMRAVAGAISRLEYDPRRGTFRSWLFTVVRNKFRNYLSNKTRKQMTTGGSSVQELLEAQPDRVDALQEQWDHEYDERVFSWAVDRVKGSFTEKTWQAFWQVSVEGKNARDVARDVGISVGAVYIAKSRVLARLKEQIQLLQGEPLEEGVVHD
jgi:RNA polymerase sigma-70 factor (ECF subfamily)